MSSNLPLVILIILFATSGCSTTHMIKSVHDERVLDSLSKAQFVQVSFEQQLTDYGCGAAVLISVLRYWDVAKDQGYIVGHYPPRSNNGYTLGELKVIAKKIGLYAFAIKGKLFNIKEQLLKGRPVIVPIKVDSDYITEGASPFIGLISRYITKLLTPSYDHYVVVFGYDKKLIWVMDPVMGIRSINIAQFLEMWESEQNAMLLVSR